MESIKMDKDYFDQFKKDFQSYAEMKNPLLKRNLPKFFKKLYDIYFILPSYVTEMIFNNVYFRRDFIPKNIKKVKMPPELSIDFLGTEQIHNKYEETMQKEIDKFLEILEKNFKPKDLTFFFRNIESLDFQKIEDKKDNTLAYYTAKDNKITFIKDFNSNTIIHELFHMASSYYEKDQDISYIGFRQKGKDLDIGIGLNEGYTEVLANRYSNINESRSYIHEKKYAKILEDIIGKDLMQSLYLQANLKGLINELTKYQTGENIRQFLQNMDLWETYKDDLSLKEKMDNCLKGIEIFLLKAYLEKTKIQIKEMTFENQNSLMFFLQEARTKAFEIGSVFSINEIDNIIDNYLNDIIKEKKEQIDKLEWEQKQQKIQSAINQELDELEEKFGKIKFNSEPIKVESMDDFTFYSDDEVPKR